MANDTAFGSFTPIDSLPGAAARAGVAGGIACVPKMTHTIRQVK